MQRASDESPVAEGPPFIRKDVIAIQSSGDSGVQASLLEYLRWSCDRLVELLDRERERRHSLENKATQAFVATAATAGLALDSLRAADAPPEWYLVGTILAVLSALTTALLSLVVRSSSGASAEAHFDDDGTTAADDVLSRINRVRHNLRDSIREVHLVGERKASLVWWAQVLAAVSIGMLIGAVVWPLVS